MNTHRIVSTGLLGIVVLVLIAAGAPLGSAQEASSGGSSGGAESLSGAASPGSSLSGTSGRDASLPGASGEGTLEGSGKGGLSGTSDGLTGGVESSAANLGGVGAGATAADLMSLRSAVAHGATPSPDDMERLCAGVAARHMGAEEIESVASSLGLSADQVARIKGCAQGQAAGARQAPSTDAKAAAAAPARSGPDSDKVSSIEDAFRGLANPIGRTSVPTTVDLEQFGYSLFSAPGMGVSPSVNAPVGSDYVLGPGDELKLMVWGRFNNTLHLKVENEGMLMIPEIGPIEVAGLTFEQVEKIIEGRVKQITGLQATITMGQIRTIQVFVVGKVNHPGMYSVSSLAHVSNALAAAGGISKIGSLRTIELRRDNQVLRTIDLYDVLLHGRTAADIRLRESDVIFVPVIGPVVGVTGNVKAPAIYELRGSEDLASVLKMAGGVGAFGYSERLQVKRVDNHQRRIVCDVELGRIDRARFQVRDGDLIKVFTVLPQEQDVVKLAGNANRPGAYQWRSGMRVSDLLSEAEGAADHTFYGYAVIRRIESPDQRVRFIPINLGTALANSSSPDSNPILRPRDVLTIYNQQDLSDIPQVTISGAVRKAASYPLTEGMRVSDLVYEAGGLKDSAYTNRAELVSTQVVDGSARYIYRDVDLAQALGRSESANPKLRPGDELVVQQASNWHKPWTVEVKGEVLRPGPYLIHQGDRLDSVLVRCGGLTADAYLPAAVFIRQSVQEMEQKRLDESRRRLEAQVARISLMPNPSGGSDESGDTMKQRSSTLEMVQHVLADANSKEAVGRVVLHLDTLQDLRSSRDDLILQDADKVVIPKRPDAVAVLGQVYNPSAIVFEPNHTVQDYLQKAGGPTEWADADHLYLIRANGEIVTDESARSSGNAALFPLLPALSGGIRGVYIDRGDTVYVPEKLIYKDNLKIATSVTQIIANTAMSLGMLGILATHL